MYTILPINKKCASEIVTWRYPAPYNVYDLDNSEEGIQELMEGGFWAVRKNNELIGYLCFGIQARISCGIHKGYYSSNYIDIGLALRPDLVSQGLGQEFLQRALDFARQVYENDKIRLTVAAFNERAIKVYQQVGFSEQMRFISHRPGGDTEFIIMTLTAAQED